MRLIGITGGVGAGKSEILQYIKKHYKCEIYLADQVAHEVQSPGQPCYQKIVELMGAGILQDDGTIDRAKMASRIFLEKDLLLKVNALVHPAVQNYLLDRVKEAGQNPEVELFFIEAALLIETGYKEIVDEMWYIYADEKVRRNRLEANRGYTPQKITQIMDKQLSEEAFREACDFVIDNSGVLEDSFRQIDERLKTYSRRV
ncbi:MAG: dephospho-CoA kinase [Lachnospiraceae bacterium]|nr:dephospho-CoA kinase [Lachnospiraceae bacterium]